MPRAGHESSRVVRERAILRAAIEELARADYGGLSFERVALRAGVNKTTVYRRWETKADLVRAALTSLAQELRPGPTTGSLRGDLLRIGRSIRQFAASFEGQCLMRLRLLQHPEPELARMARELHSSSLGDIAALGRAAVKRGEIRTEKDMRLLVEMLNGAIHTRLLMEDEPSDDAVLTRFVDVLLHGVGQGGRRSASRGQFPVSKGAAAVGPTGRRREGPQSHRRGVPDGVG
ncbi:MAG: TetR/AcrR family transcriptional regulator [Polyangiaceae bacterium]